MLQDKINGLFGLHPHRDLGGNLAFFIVALGWSLCLFLVLSLISRFAFGKLILHCSGILAMVALPAVWFYVFNPVIGPLPNPPHLLLFLELIVVTVCGVLYLLIRWPFPDWTAVLFLVLHFAFWGWLFLGGPYFWRSPIQLSIPLAGLASSLAWGLLIKKGTSGTQLKP